MSSAGNSTWVIVPLAMARVLRCGAGRCVPHYRRSGLDGFGRLRLDAREEGHRRIDHATRLVDERAPLEQLEELRAAVAIRPVRVPVPQLLEDPGRRTGHEWRDRKADEPAGLHEVAEDAREPCGGGLIAGLGLLVERPGLLG